MRAVGRDIVELFGYSPDDMSKESIASHGGKRCPFVGSACTKTNHDQSIVYGVCSVSKGVRKDSELDVIVCPKRLYYDNYTIFKQVVQRVWGNGLSLIVGGTVTELKNAAHSVDRPAIAFGQNSGKEVSANSNGSLSMDWVIQSYVQTNDELKPDQFIGIEVQSIDITGNYRDNWAAYQNMKKSPNSGDVLEGLIPNSGHGLNWANVHKRLIPQIIRKGNLYRRIERCAGFFFLVPEVVYQRFEAVIGKLEPVEGPARDHISIFTYVLGENVASGHQREVIRLREVHLKLDDVAQAFVSNVGPEAPAKLDKSIAEIL